MTEDFVAALLYLRSLIIALDDESLAPQQDEAKRRLAGQDEDDWLILAAALSLGCAVWTEDRDFFGTGIATRTTNRVEIYLEAEMRKQEP